jgi:type 1 glutamine amidotransferase
MAVSTLQHQLVFVSQVAPYRDEAGAEVPAGIHHGLTSTAQGLAELAELAGLSFRHPASVRELQPDDLEDVGVLALATIGETPWPPLLRTAIENRVARGRMGILGLHSATDASRDWISYGKLVGARFDGHPLTTELPVAVLDRTHPSTRHLPELWRVRDELYLFTDWQRDNRTLLAVRMGPRATYHEAELPAPRDLPLAWCRTFGRGRCFYTALGHFATAWEDSNYVRHVMGGIEWVLDADRSEPPAADR